MTLRIADNQVIVHLSIISIDVHTYFHACIRLYKIWIHLLPLLVTLKITTAVRFLPLLQIPA